jgi:hypothetical protein
LTKKGRLTSEGVGFRVLQLGNASHGLPLSAPLRVYTRVMGNVPGISVAAAASRPRTAGVGPVAAVLIPSDDTAAANRHRGRHGSPLSGRCSWVTLNTGACLCVKRSAAVSWRNNRSSKYRGPTPTLFSSLGGVAVAPSSWA